MKSGFSELRESVQEYRVRHGLTQSQMAKECGVSRVTICNIERKSYHRPNLVTVHKIEKVIKEKEKENND